MLIAVERAGAGGAPQRVVTYDLTDVLVTRFRSHSGGTIPTESITLNYSKITITYFEQSSNGSTVIQHTVTYDVKANTTS